MKEGTEEKVNVTKPESLNLKDTLKRWSQVTTCAGIIDLYMAKSFTGKTFWAIFISFCFGFTLWQAFDLFRLFLTEHPYQSQMDIVVHEHIPFPNVTICNFNRIDETLISNLTLDREVFSYIFSTAGLNYNIEKQYEEQIDIFLTRWREMKLALNVTDIISLYTKYGHSCEDTFLLCKWQLQKFDCCKYATEVILSYGRCWTMLPNLKNNPENLVQQPFPGIFYGLQLIINPKLKAYLNNVFYNNMLERGVIVMTEYTEMTYSFDYKVVQSGMHSWLSLDGRLETVKTYREYSKDNCEVDCWAELHIKHCNCTNAIATLNEPYEMCSVEKYFRCISNIPKNSSLVDDFLAKCRTGCLNSCDNVWSVGVSQTDAKFFGDTTQLASSSFWEDLLPNETDRETILNSLIAMNLYFSTLSYTKIETGEAYPILNFIGDIGGQLSLFLGISIVTIVQMIWYVCIYTFPNCCQVKSFEMFE